MKWGDRILPVLGTQITLPTAASQGGTVSLPGTPLPSPTGSRPSSSGALAFSEGLILSLPFRLIFPFLSLEHCKVPDLF